MRKIVLFFGLSIIAFNVHAQISAAARSIANNLLQKNEQLLGLSTDDLKNSVISDTYTMPASDMRMIYLQQSYQGIPVYNQIQTLAFKNDVLVSNAGHRMRGLELLSRNASPVPSVTAANAVRACLDHLKVKSPQDIRAITTSENGYKISFGKQNISIENISAELMWMPVAEDKELKLVWQVFVAPFQDEDYWLVRIDAHTNTVINKQSLTVKCNWDDPHAATKHVDHTNECIDAVNIDAASSGNSLSASGPTVVNTATYRVIKYPAESPQHPGGAHTLVTDPWTMSPGNATSLGWHFNGTSYFTNTRGNNVYAYEDRNADNLPGAGSSPASTTAQPSLTLNFTPNFTQEPTVTSPQNQQFNITNLFYWNNLMHDLSYIYGFDEGSRNFQNDNQGRGGSGLDYVLAEAQDGSGTNNANFSTPTDGQRPRMQMYLWTSPTPDRDGDVDNGIIAHEYTHGISNRLTGNGSSCLTNAEQMGEGWSDYFALMITQDWAASQLTDGFSKPRGIGTYALAQATTGVGIRQYRYCTDMSVNPMTYGNLPNVVAPHGVGTIWCTALWDMTWEIIQQNGNINPNIYNIAGGGGNSIALKLVVEGMRLQPCSPGFIDGRNAILKADSLFFGGQYKCAIIKAFARRGMGIGASQGSSNSRTDQTLSFVDCNTCVAPTGLTSSAITSGSATVAWNAVSGAVSYTVEYKLNTSATWLTAAAATTATSVNISGLAAASVYDWRARTNCSGGSSSNTQAQFTTTSASGCAAPATLTTTSITTTSAVANWTAVAGALSYRVEYKLNSGATWNVLATATTATSQSITGLTSNTAYNWRVLTNCSGGTSAYAQANFTTAQTGCSGNLDVFTNGSPSGAAQIPLNSNVTGLISTTTDNDYYKFVITTTGTATLSLTTLPFDYDLYLYSSNGSTLLAYSENGSNTSESIGGTYNAGTYYARIFGYNGAYSTTSCYTLRLTTGTATLGDNLMSHAAFGKIGTSKASVFPNPANRSVTVNLEEMKGSADLLLYDIYGKLLSRQTTGKSSTRMDISSLSAGTYIIKVRNSGKETNLKFVKQ